MQEEYTRRNFLKKAGIPLAFVGLNRIVTEASSEIPDKKEPIRYNINTSLLKHSARYREKLIFS